MYLLMFNMRVLLCLILSKWHSDINELRGIKHLNARIANELRLKNKL